MPQENPPRKIKKHQQMIQGLELRAAGLSYQQIATALGVSKTRAYRIVAAALTELVEECRETAEQVRVLELRRLDRYRLALDSKRSDPRVADTLIRISERVARLHGIDAPQRIEASGLNGGPIQTEEKKLDFSAFSHDELAIYAALTRKAEGDPEWANDIRYYGTDHHVRQWPGKPLSLLTVFARALLPEAAGAATSH